MCDLTLGPWRSGCLLTVSCCLEGVLTHIPPALWRRAVLPDPEVSPSGLQAAPSPGVILTSVTASETCGFNLPGNTHRPV